MAPRPATPAIRTPDRESNAPSAFAIRPVPAIAMGWVGILNEQDAEVAEVVASFIVGFVRYSFALFSTNGGCLEELRIL
jgi:hypothetical protein